MALIETKRVTPIETQLALLKRIVRYESLM